MAANRYLSRAETATRSSKRVALSESVDYVELVRDIAAMANSGGGAIVFDGVAGIDEGAIHEQLERYAEPEFETFTVEPMTRNGRPSVAVVVEGVRNTPLVFTRTGRIRGEHIAFVRGGLYVRHGAKSEPATGEDVRDFIRRQLEATRTQWLANIRQVMHAPDGAEVAVIETAERDEEGRPTLIRLTTDPHAPLYGQVDPDQIASASPEGGHPRGERAPGRRRGKRVRRVERAAGARDLRGDASGVRPCPEVRLGAIQRCVRGLARQRAPAGSSVLRAREDRLSRNAPATLGQRQQHIRVDHGVLALDAEVRPLLDDRAVGQLLECLDPISTPPTGARLSSRAPVLTVSPTSG